MVSLPMVYFSRSTAKGFMDECVGIKLRCVLNAAYEKRIRSSSKAGYPHLITSVALGTTFLRMARSSRSVVRASFGAALMYSVTVVGLAFGILSNLGICDERIAIPAGV